ncbi:MAG TPA: amidohydrolase family protein [Anaerolineae bacterium]|nr:amidohydrolase family protein [Anaerolineae bacterium]HOR00127.1 amidohydrolase family protein [Anaerolineae bacterium]HPL28178.1 amidohydrolase family protein [Anaerolineae bacterium]
MDLDLVIKNGAIVDGTGRPRFRADLAVAGGRIAAVSAGAPLSGRAVIDATGLAVAPGFLDTHSHADWILPLAEHERILAPLVLQGITTIVGGNCGFSPAPARHDAAAALDEISESLRDRAFPYAWQSFAEFLASLERGGLLLNLGCLVGHGALRTLAMGERSGPPTPEELETMRRLAREALRDGALGFSAGLAYAPGVFAKNDELLALLETVAAEGGVFTVHGRAYSWVSPFYQPMFLGAAHNLRSTRELLDLAKQAGVRLQLSHLIFVGRRTWRTHRAVLREVERAAESGLDVGFDAFPYTVGNTTIKVVFPEWFLDGFLEKVNDPTALRRLKREINLLQWALGIEYRDLRLLWACVPELAHLEGLDFAAIAERLGLPPFAAYMHVARLSQGKARILLDTYSGDPTHEAPLRAALAHPLCAFITDTILTSKGAHNPASFGTYPRILGRYCRDLGLFPLEEAVRRMTALPAARLGLEGVGRIAEGLSADLVLFDPETVADNTAPGRSDAPPSGIKAVLIGGEVVARDGQMVPGVRKGRVLRK